MVNCAPSYFKFPESSLASRHRWGEKWTLTTRTTRTNADKAPYFSALIRVVRVVRVLSSAAPRSKLSNCYLYRLLTFAQAPRNIAPISFSALNVSPEPNGKGYHELLVLRWGINTVSKVLPFLRRCGEFGFASAYRGNGIFCSSDGSRRSYCGSYRTPDLIGFPSRRRIHTGNSAGRPVSHHRVDRPWGDGRGI